jgi:hypothetical protein
MKPFIIALLLFLMMLVISNCQAQQLQPGQLLEDLNYFKDTLPVKHKNLFSKISKTNFESRIAAIASNINNLNTESFIAELFKLNVSIGDEHTNLFLTYPLRFPFQSALFDEGMVILAADSANQKLLLSRIIAIDGQSITAIDEKFTTVIKQDNPSYFKVWKTFYFNNPSFLKGLGIVKDSGKALFTTISLKGDTVTTLISAADKNNMPNMVRAKPLDTLLPYLQLPNKSYWYRFIKDSSILYFNFLQCKNQEAEPFEQFNSQLFTAVQNTKPQKIIIDLRFNSGGNSAILQPFIDSIKKSYLNTTSTFYVLIGKTTFSSAVMNAVDFKRNTKAIFIGYEPTGGSVNHYGEVRGFRLPNTKIEVAYSTRYWENWKGYKGGLKPDIVLPHSLANFANGKDEALEYIYKH